MFDLIYDFLINRYLGDSLDNLDLKIELAKKLSWFVTIMIFLAVFYFVYVLFKIIFNKWRDY